MYVYTCTHCLIDYNYTVITVMELVNYCTCYHVKSPSLDYSVIGSLITPVGSFILS